MITPYELLILLVQTIYNSKFYFDKHVLADAHYLKSTLMITILQLYLLGKSVSLSVSQSVSSSVSQSVRPSVRQLVSQSVSQLVTS